MEREPRIRFSVSYTTRKPRPNEIAGRDYHFVTPERFDEMAARKASFSSTRRFSTIATAPACARCEEALANGEQLLLEIDWQGARQVRAAAAGGAQHFHSAAVARMRWSSGSRRAAPIPTR